MQKLIIGSNTENFYRITDEKNSDKLLSEYLITPNTSAIEIIINDQEPFHCQITPENIKDIGYWSIHAPVYAYQHDEKSHNILQYINNLCSRFPIKNIVIHPNKVMDRSIFSEYKHLPFSIENMDKDKETCKNIQDLEKIFNKNPQLYFTLDIQHAFTNDPSMQLAKEFHTAFGEKIKEYHISGFHETYLHYPLFKTQQTEIIQAIQKPHLPLIIESTFDNKNELDKEILYISQYLSS